MSKNKSISDGGINGLGTGIVNTNSIEFKALQAEIIKHSKEQSKEQILENNLLSLRFQMESYLDRKEVVIIEVGWFLKEFIKTVGVKNKIFAEYIGFKDSNLSDLFSGKRKINIDLALKLGKIFKLDPELWIHIQSKNELIRMREENKNKYQKYSIDDLVRKAS